MFLIESQIFVANIIHLLRDRQGSNDENDGESELSNYQGLPHHGFSKKWKLSFDHGHSIKRGKEEGGKNS